MCRSPLLIPATLAALGLAQAAQAQQPMGWGTETTAFFGVQGDADLAGGGDVATSRSFVGVGALNRLDSGLSLGFSIGYGLQSYDFGGGAAALWGDVETLSLSLPVQARLGNGADIFVAPTMRSTRETGAGTSDSVTYGVFAGISWQVSDRLRVGPAFGAFSELEGDGIDAFPAIVLDWEISDRWTLSTGGGTAASRGPGLRLAYAASDALSLGLEARLEQSEFRLDGTGPAPGGIGEDRSVPVVLTLDYAPNPGLSLSAFAGVALDGELTLRDANGTLISTRAYDTAPVAGLSLRLRF